ncbi:MAG: serine hydrolase domain-containing protein [Pseudomonadota bacterium]
MSFLAVAALIVTPPDFQALLDHELAEQDTPGISAVVSRGDDILFAGGSGVANLETSTAIDADTVFYAGSVSKVFTAVLALRLVERGNLELTDRVAALRIGPNPANAVTVEQLLTHASGLQREGDFGYWWTGDFPTRTQLRDYLGRAEMRSAPGAALHYSNVGYATLGLIIENKSNRSFATLLEETLTTPLGLGATGVPGPPPGIVPGYTPKNRIIPSRERPFAGVGRQVGDRYVREYHDAAAMSPAFGIYTSANDLGTLARFLLSPAQSAVLSAEMRERMRTRQSSGWGLGLKLGRLDGSRVARHDGWFAAHRSHLLLDAARRISVVVFTNSDGGAPSTVAENLYRAARAD